MPVFGRPWGRAQKISNSARWGDCIYLHTLGLKRHTILLWLRVRFLVRFLVPRLFHPGMPTNFEGNPLRLFAGGRLSFLPWGLGAAAWIPPQDVQPPRPLKMPLVRSKKPSQIPSPALLGIFFTNFSINLLLLSSSLEARAQKISNSARWGDCIYLHTLGLKRHTILLWLRVSF